jgi:cholesterol oxidase
MTHYDVVIVGSGFGGSTAALRLTEKGYRVGVLEAGRRFEDSELPRTSWDLRRYLWAPALKCFGIQRFHLLPGRPGVLVVAGAGVGGGSLNYANTLYRPPSRYFTSGKWAGITDWEAELTPHYDQATRMLGVTTNPLRTPVDDVFRTVARQMGVEHTFTPTQVGVYFGPQHSGDGGKDPFFGGAGPERQACTACGSCMTGCRVGAKNTLVKNYLYLAERAGADVHPLTTVTNLTPTPGGWRIDTRRTGRRSTRSFTADQVVVAAGTYGTQKLLLTLRDRGDLPRLSGRLGELTRTNSEAVLAATRSGGGSDLSRGIAITSSVHLDDDTHLESVRYGKGSNVIGLLQTVLVDGGGRLPRPLKALGVIARHPVRFARTLSVRRWSERTIIALVMQNVENSVTVFRRRGVLTSRRADGEPIPTWIPAGHEAVRRIATEIGGDPGGAWTDLVNIPMTAHFLGGCVIGSSAAEGVIDPYHRAFGYDGLTIADGSTVSGNLGVNPSLTITAMAERAFSLWPNKGDADPRPATGEPYVQVTPVAPRRPAVPAHAPAALRTPGLRT